MSWLKSQRGFKNFARSLDILAGQDSGYSTSVEYRSKVSTNRLKRNVREVVGAMSKLRPMWGYHSDNKAYADYAEMMNKTTKAWYLKAMADRSVKEALQYAAATGRGWCRPVYRRDMGGTGKGDIKLFTYGAPCVLPFQLPATGDWQAAYSVTILEEMPVYMAHAMFPLYQDRLNPSTSRYWYANDGVRKASLGNILQRIFGKTQRGSSTEALTDLLVPIRYCYVIDLSVNKTDKEIVMGEPGASWSYTVPYVGQDIPVGNDPRSGTTLFRKANETDARLYPYRRLLISSDRTITYDGPSFDWHGMVPAVSFTMDEWPWEPLGFPLVHDGYEIQDAINKILRGNMDKIGQQLHPSLAFDTNATNMSEARRYDPYKPDDRIGIDGSAVESGQAFFPTVSEETLRVSPESMAMVEKLEQTLDNQMAIADVMSLAKMRAVGSMDDLEKVMEANGPIIEDLSRAMEPPMRDLGVMIKYLICQFYTTPRLMQWVGADGIAPGVFDYQPDSLVPSHMPGEDPKQPSPTDRIRRARTFADNLEFFILPNSLHEITQMQMKLLLIQLRKAGIMIDSQTIAEACNVPNFGAIDGNNCIERWTREQEMQLEIAARGKLLADTLGLTPPAPAGGGAPPGAPKPNGSAPEGRPSSFSAPPSLQQKDGGSRSTVATSK